MRGTAEATGDLADRRTESSKIRYNKRRQHQLQSPHQKSRNHLIDSVLTRDGPVVCDEGSACMLRDQRKYCRIGGCWHEAASEEFSNGIQDLSADYTPRRLIKTRDGIAIIWLLSVAGQTNSVRD